MSSNNVVLNFDEIDLNQYLVYNHLTQTTDFGHQFTKGLALDVFLNGLIAKVSNNLEKCDVWNDVLLDIIDNNAINESMLSEVLKIAVNKTKSDSIANRVFSCKMLSKLSQRLDESNFIDKILPSVQYLCHDFNSSVRASISKLLFIASINISSQTIKTLILPQMIELMKDNDFFVRITTIESLIDIIPKLDDESKGIVLPKIVHFFDASLSGPFDNYLVLIFVNFGKLCQILPNDVIAGEKWFLNYYCKIFLICNNFQVIAANNNFKERDIQCRNLLALYFPILLQIYGRNDILFSILNFLCSDIDITVVQTIASNFNQINAYLMNGYELYPQLSKLLNQKSIFVTKELMPFLSDLLIDTIKKTPNENLNNLLDDMIVNLIGCENSICLNRDWRLQIEFYECLTVIMPYFPANAIKVHFLPLILHRILTSRPIPLRIASSRCVISIYQKIPSLLEVLNIYEWFVTTLCFGKSCFQRMLFLNVCEIIDELCDKHIMISYFLEPLLNLREDIVPNIRLNVCKKFKALKHLLKIPEISDRIEQIKQMFRQMLKKEKDVDVIDSINQLILEFEWKLIFDELDIEELAIDLVSLTIDDLSISKVDNNSIDFKDETNSDKSDSIKQKSSLPQLIRSQSNTNCKYLPTNHINNSLFPSKIPKPITKCSK